MTIKLNVGSGCVHLPGYTRVDCDPECQPDICCRIENLDDHVKPGSVEEIRAYHVLEHIAPGRPLYKALRMLWQLLRPGGVLSVAVPDCEHAMYAFARGEYDLAKAESIIMGSDNGATEHMLHRTMFSPAKLVRYLHITGFVDIDQTIVTPGEVRATAARPEKGTE